MSYKQAVGAAAIIAAAGVAVIYAAGQVIDVSMRATPVGSDEMTIGAALAVGEAAAASLLGGVLAWLLCRRSRRGPTIFLVIVAVVFVALSISAVTAGEDGGTVAVLLLMHVAVLIPTLVLVLPRLTSIGEAATARRQTEQRISRP